MVLFVNSLAGVAKWLRQWVVIPSFAGSSPVTRPTSNILKWKARKIFEISMNFQRVKLVLEFEKKKLTEIFTWAVP